MIAEKGTSFIDGLFSEYGEVESRMEQNNNEGALNNFWRTVTVFFGVAYLIGSGFVVLGIVTGQEILYYIAASSGSLAGIITAYLSGGVNEVKKLIAQFKNWRSSYWLYFFAVFSPWVFVLIGLGIYRIANPAPSVDYSLWVTIPVVFLMTTVQAGLGEELGWRGFITPKLNKYFTLAKSATIVGIGWAFWHLPLFFIPDFGWNVLAGHYGFFTIYAPYAVSLVLMSVLYSWLHSRGGQNIILPIILHGSINTAALAFNYMDIEVYNNLIVLFVPAILFGAVSIILLFRSPVLRMKG